MKKLGWCIAAVLLAVGVESCKKKEPPPRKPKREEIMREAASDRRSVLKFAEALKEMLAHEHSASVGQSDMKQLSARLESIPRGGLPEDLGRAWQKVLKIFRRGAAGENSKGFHAEGQAASDELNAALRANGIVDFRF